MLVFVDNVSLLVRLTQSGSLFFLILLIELIFVLHNGVDGLLSWEVVGLIILPSTADCAIIRGVESTLRVAHTSSNLLEVSTASNMAILIEDLSVKVKHKSVREGHF